MIRTASLWAAGAAMLVGTSAALAFPDKPLTIVVPFSAGTTTDINAREFAMVLSEIVKQPVVIDNRVGAEGVLGAQALLNAPPDGHTLLFTSNSLPVLDPLMKKNLPYDVARDMTPLCTLARTSNVMNVTAGGPMKSVADVIAAARANPGKVTYAYASTIQRLAGELFQQSAGVKFTGVPYRSSATALTEVAGGQVDLIFIDHVSAVPYYQNGRVRPIAVAGAQRFKSIGEVPTAVEAGVPKYTIQPWFGFYASARTPGPIVAQLRQLLEQAMKAPAELAHLDKRDLQPLALCGDAHLKHQADDTALLRQVLQNAGIRPE